MTSGAAFDDDRFAEQNMDLGSTAGPCRFDLIPFRDVTYSKDKRWLVKGLLASTGLATIFGPPKQYKSFVAVDLGLHIAAGRTWAGRRVRQGVVVYIVGEGQSGFADRVAANREHRGYPDDLPFFLIKARPDLGTGAGDRAELIKAIEKGTAHLRDIDLGAIFIDTLVRTLAGASENDEGMRNFTDNAEAIADHFDCAVVAVHHTGKDATRGMRGSSALHGAVVTSWSVEKAKPFQAIIKLEDAKDGESGMVWTADLERVVIGHDEDGEEESVLLVERLSEPASENVVLATDKAPSADRPPPQLRLFIACLDAAMTASGFLARPFHDGPEFRVVPLEAVRAEYYARRGDEAKAEAKRKSFNNSLKAGLERRAILVEPVGGEKVIWKAKAA